MSDEVERCPACGGEMNVRCHIGAGYYVCCKCGSVGSREIALKIAKSKHKEKLEKIWTELEKEE